MKVVATDWRELVVGSEGFLTGRGREGLKGQEVVWGEMDSMVRPFYEYYGCYQSITVYKTYR